jgi:hypothetical protein
MSEHPPLTLHSLASTRVSYILRRPAAESEQVTEARKPPFDKGHPIQPQLMKYPVSSHPAKLATGVT